MPLKLAARSEVERRGQGRQVATAGRQAPDIAQAVDGGTEPEGVEQAGAHQPTIAVGRAGQRA